MLNHLRNYNSLHSIYIRSTFDLHSISIRSHSLAICNANIAHINRQALGNLSHVPPIVPPPHPGLKKGKT